MRLSESSENCVAFVVSLAFFSRVCEYPSFFPMCVGRFNSRLSPHYSVAFRKSSFRHIMSSFKISKIEIIIKDEGGDDEEEQGPKEVPMFDQTMSLLEMIKEKKVRHHQQSKTIPERLRKWHKKEINLADNLELRESFWLYPS